MTDSLARPTHAECIEHMKAGGIVECLRPFKGRQRRINGDVHERRDTPTAAWRQTLIPHEDAMADDAWYMLLPAEVTVAEAPPNEEMKNKKRQMGASHWIAKPGEFYFCVSIGDELLIKIGKDTMLKQYVYSVPDLQWEGLLLDKEIRTLEAACKLVTVKVSAELEKLRAASNALYHAKVPTVELDSCDTDLDAPSRTSVGIG